MTPNEIIQAISIDINWDMFARPSSRGLYGHADPREQVRWVHGSWTAEQVESHRRKELKQATLDWFHADVKNLAILREAYQTV
jgi:hypothetical protein